MKIINRYLTQMMVSRGDVVIDSSCEDIVAKVLEVTGGPNPEQASRIAKVHQVHFLELANKSVH